MIEDGNFRPQFIYLNYKINTGEKAMPIAIS
ncbi:hypothetical protein SAMN05444408_10944 [Chryseobacterium takakiae]|jgi:hypothetical protein|uniref:Uncharacterized protein n=1 Tax=Chryseobacterium takakiae TaxID=1302685 RepID=A0A1M4Z171_9FLAO|nr:hypothetical protein SAMN05444408_10944 [Chryseobacterium takakiae]